MRRLVVGIGSPFGADRLGWDVVDALSATPPEATDLHQAEHPGPGLLETLSAYEAAVIVDAMRSRYAPGEVIVLDPAAIGDAGTSMSSHGIGLADTLALGRILDMLPARLRVVGVEAAGDLPDPAAVAAAERCVRHLLAGDLLG